MSDIGIVIVTYNSEAEIGACLDAALRTGADVVVVDNASSDGTIAEVARRGVRLIANPDEPGFRRRRQSRFCRIELAIYSAAESGCGAPERPGSAPRGLRPARRGGRGRTASGRRRPSADRFHGAPAAHPGRADFGSSLAEPDLAEQPGQPAVPRAGPGLFAARRKWNSRRERF